MSIDFSKTKALSFDCYGTLIDWETGLLELLRPWFSDAGIEIADDLILLAFGTYSERHQNVRPALLYPEVLRRTWRDIEAHFGMTLDSEKAEKLARSVPKWPAFADTTGALNRLATRFKLVILSNIDDGSIAETRKTLAVPFHAVVTAEQVGAYKPEKRHFERMFQLLKDDGIEPCELVHVGQSRFHDIEPADELGLQTVFIYRRHKKGGVGASIAANIEPDLLLNSLVELADTALDTI